MGGTDAGTESGGEVVCSFIGSARTAFDTAGDGLALEDTTGTADVVGGVERMAFEAWLIGGGSGAIPTFLSA